MLLINALSKAIAVFVIAFICCLTCSGGTLLYPVGTSNIESSTVVDVAHFSYDLCAFDPLNISAGFGKEFGLQRQSGFLSTNTNASALTWPACVPVFRVVAYRYLSAVRPVTVSSPTLSTPFKSSRRETSCPAVINL